MNLTAIDTKVLELLSDKPRKLRLIDRNQLVKELLGIVGAKILGVTLVTKPAMNKTNNPYYGLVRKFRRLSVMVNYDYEAAVNRRLNKEGKSPTEFVAGDSWHEPLLTLDGKLTPLAKHKDDPTKLYLRCREQSASEAIFMDFTNGLLMSKIMLEPFLKKSSGYKNQGLDKPVVHITPSIDNIHSLSIDGETLLVK